MDGEFQNAEEIGDSPLHRLVLERSEKSYQRGAVGWRQIEAEGVSLDGARLDTGAAETRRHIVVPQPPRVKPVLERSDRAVVLEWSAVPDAFERWHLVVPVPRRV